MATISVRGVMTSRAFFSENSNTPSRSAASRARSAPLFWLRSTSSRSSSGECTDCSSVGAPVPSRTATKRADRTSSQVNGRATCATTRSGAPRTRSTRSGCASATARGTSSPNTRWRYAITTNASRIRTPASRRPSPPIGTSPKLRARSTPSPRLESVMPSWLVDSISGSAAFARSANAASRLPPRASASSRARRDRTSANSAATKSAFATSSTRMATSRRIIGCAPRDARLARERRQA